MNYRTLAAPGPSWGSNSWAKAHRQHRRVQSNASASGDASSSGRGSYFDRVKGIEGVCKAALTSATLSSAGDLLAQFAQGEVNKRKGKQPPPYDPYRTLRMFGFGLSIYGPVQYYWYNLLGWLMPTMNTTNFLVKVAANQLVLAPCTLSTVFSWNLALTGQADAIPSKIKSDLWPTMVNGWKFWIPAASVNFYAVPVDKQVLYMSVCGVLWTAYLSYASQARISAPAPEPAVEAAPAGGDKKGGKKGAKGK